MPAEAAGARPAARKALSRQSFSWRQVLVLEQVFETDPLPRLALRIEPRRARREINHAKLAVAEQRIAIDLIEAFPDHVALVEVAEVGRQQVELAVVLDERREVIVAEEDVQPTVGRVAVQLLEAWRGAQCTR